MFPGRPSEHLLRVLADRLHAPVNLVDRDDRGLVNDNALPAGVNAGIRRAEVDGQIVRKQGKKRAEAQSVVSFLSDVNTVLSRILYPVHGAISRS